MKSSIAPALGAVVLVLLPVTVLAQGAPAPGPAAQPAAAPAAAGAPAAEGGRPLAACRADAEALCAGAERGELRRCLNDNKTKLSPGCQTALADLAARAKAMREACQGDVEALCGETKAGEAAPAPVGRRGGQTVQCLRANAAKLSPACSMAIEARFPKS